MDNVFLVYGRERIEMTVVTSGNGFDYYELITVPLADNGMGIRLYLRYNDNYYMATDTANGSTAVGQSYWLSN